MKKRSLVVVLCLVMMLLFAACTPSTPTDTQSSKTNEGQTQSPETDEDKVEISFMGWGTDAEIATFQAMIDQFEDMYTGVEVEYITVADNEFDTKLQSMIGSGTSPDVFYVPIDNLMKYAASGALYDISDYVANNDVFDVDNIWDSLIDLYRFDGLNQGSGPIYALPKDVSVFPIFYNVDMFEAANITPPTNEDPWDWDDFLDAATKLTNGTGDDKVYGTGAYSLESAVWSNGAEWIDQETLTEIQVTDPKFIEAMQWCADLRLVHEVAPTAAESSALGDWDRYKQGKLAMVGSGTWSISDAWNNIDFEWDVMNWPVSPNTGKSEIWFGSAGIGVSAATKHAEASQNLAAFLSFNEEAQRTAYTMGQAIPMLKDMAQGDYSEFEKGPKSKDVLFYILENSARLASQSRTFNQEWFAEFNSGSADVFEGRQTASDYVTSIAPTLQSLLDDSIAQKLEFME